MRGSVRNGHSSADKDVHSVAGQSQATYRTDAGHTGKPHGRPPAGHTQISGRPLVRHMQINRRPSVRHEAGL